MPKQKGTAKSLTPKKASKRKIIIKRPSKVVKSKPTTKTTSKVSKKRSPKGSVFSFEYAGVKYNLSARQLKFCEAYLTMQHSAAACIVEAGYKVLGERGGVNWNLARVMGSENLSKPNIKAYINKAFDDIGLSSEAIRREHAKIIFQDYDLSAKARGLDMYYKKSGEYAPDKHEHQFDKELQESLAKIAKVLP